MSYWRFYYHVVWGTKLREHTISPEIETLFRRALPGIARTDEVIPHAVGVMPDHVHLVTSIPPKIAVSAAINRLKGSSSHLISHELPNARSSGWSGWQEGYGALSLGEKALADVVAYVTHQRERHANNNLYRTLELTNEY